MTSSTKRRLAQGIGAVLAAAAASATTGLLAHVVEVLRLNTLGGVAPAGACDPQATPTVHVPYQADYVFING
jgi:Protein of unknown function (DUF3455)